jgi:hypothetical protein
VVVVVVVVVVLWLWLWLWLLWVLLLFVVLLFVVCCLLFVVGPLFGLYVSSFVASCFVVSLFLLGSSE